METLHVELIEHHRKHRIPDKSATEIQHAHTQILSERHLRAPHAHELLYAFALMKHGTATALQNCPVETQDTMQEILTLCQQIFAQASELQRLENMPTAAQYHGTDVQPCSRQTNKLQQEPPLRATWRPFSGASASEIYGSQTARDAYKNHDTALRRLDTFQTATAVFSHGRRSRCQLLSLSI